MACASGLSPTGFLWAAWPLCCMDTASLACQWCLHQDAWPYQGLSPARARQQRASQQEALQTTDHRPVQPGQTLCVTNASAAHHAVLHICSVCRVVAAWQQGVLCTRDRGTARYGFEASAAWYLAVQTVTRPTQLCVQDCGSAPAGSLADH